MPEVEIRKFATVVEEIFHEGGPRATTPLRRAAVIAVIRNPFAGSYVADIQPFMEDLKPLGLTMANRLVELLGGDPSVVEGYGKGAIVGAAGTQSVYVIREGRAERRRVRVGPDTDGRTEIFEGLAAGERVVMTGHRTLVDGDPLIIAREGTCCTNGRATF